MSSERYTCTNEIARYLARRQAFDRKLAPKTHAVYLALWARLEDQSTDWSDDGVIEGQVELVVEACAPEDLWYAEAALRETTALGVMELRSALGDLVDCRLVRLQPDHGDLDIGAADTIWLSLKLVNQEGCGGAS